MNIQPGSATQVYGIYFFSTFGFNFLCWYVCILYYDTALDCYIGFWNICPCFGAIDMVV